MISSHVAHVWAAAAVRICAAAAAMAVLHSAAAAGGSHAAYASLAVLAEYALRSHLRWTMAVRPSEQQLAAAWWLPPAVAALCAVGARLSNDRTLWVHGAVACVALFSEAPCMLLRRRSGVAVAWVEAAGEVARAGALAALPAGASAVDRKSVV